MHTEKQIILVSIDEQRLQLLDDGNPVMDENKNRTIDLNRTTPERAARIEALKAAYAEREPEELSAFGEFREKKDFFGHVIEEICDVEPAVSIGNIDENSQLDKLVAKLASKR